MLGLEVNFYRPRLGLVCLAYVGREVNEAEEV